jgi:alpha-beta hydrolase superfamily lysophospholipase
MSFLWRTHDGEDRTAHAWPSVKCRAVVACVHGLSGSGEQFAPLPERLGDYSFYALDLRGQGCDPVTRRRGMALDLEAQLLDIAAFVEALRRHHEGVPVFLMGESMGALLSANYATRSLAMENAIHGLVLSVPVVGLRREVPRFAKRALACLARFFPNAKLPPSRFVNGKSFAPPLTRDTAYQEALRQKPHHIRDYSLRFLSELGELIDGSHTVAEQVEHPVLVLSAGRDCFVGPHQIQTWFERVPSNDKTLKHYPGAYHLLWHDWDREAVVSDLEAWLEARLERISGVPKRN